MAPILEQTPRDTPDPMASRKSSMTVASASEKQGLMKRLQAELTSLMLSPSPGVSAFPDDDADITQWTGTISGPSETPYTGMTFRIAFEFPPQYPIVPPKVQFKTPIFHPNIDFSGRICLDILKEKWSAIYNVQSVLLSLQSLLGEPNNSSPLNGQAAELWDNNKEEYKRLVIARHVEPADDMEDVA